jgi:hypothetical protein
MYIGGRRSSVATTDVFNALGDVSRRQILDALSLGEAGVGEIVDRLDLDPAAGLQAPQGAARVGLVCCRSEGRHRMYQVNAPALQPLQTWLAGGPPTSTPTTTASTTTWSRCNEPLHGRIEQWPQTGSATVELPSDNEILITRSFDAPRWLVWDVTSRRTCCAGGGPIGTRW